MSQINLTTASCGPARPFRRYLQPAAPRGTAFVGGLDRMFFQNILSDIGKGGTGNPDPLTPTIPESVYICFRMTFAIITRVY